MIKYSILSKFSVIPFHLLLLFVFANLRLLQVCPCVIIWIYYNFFIVILFIFLIICLRHFNPVIAPVWVCKVIIIKSWNWRRFPISFTFLSRIFSFLVIIEDLNADYNIAGTGECKYCEHCGKNSVWNANLVAWWPIYIKRVGASCSVNTKRKM